MRSQPLLDFFLALYRIWKGNAWSKAAYLLIFLGATSLFGIAQYVIAGVFEATGHKVNIPDTPTWLGLLIIAAGMSFFVLGRWLPEQAVGQKVSPHDVKLFADFKELITPNALAFVREHNFRVQFNRAKMKPFEALAYDWRGARYEFQDQQVQAEFAKVFQTANLLDDQIGLYTYPCDGNPQWATPLNRVDERGDVTEKTWENIQKMNDTSTRLANEIDAFERVATSRIVI